MQSDDAASKEAEGEPQGHTEAADGEPPRILREPAAGAMLDLVRNSAGGLGVHDRVEETVQAPPPDLSRIRGAIPWPTRKPPRGKSR
jgi:hypothetical protein